MTNLLRLSTFRALAPDEGAGGAAPEASAAPDFEALADAAYDVATEEGEDRSERTDETDGDDEAAPESHEPEAGPLGIPAEIFERYPAVGGLLSMDAGLTDPATAGEVLRTFAQGVATYHGQDLASMLGLGGVSDPGPRFEEGGSLAGFKDWRSLGYDSAAEYEASPDYERAGFQSAGEYALARRLDALQAQVAPAMQAQARAVQEARFEAIVRRSTPDAAARVRAETGWRPSAEQVMRAARAYPELAAQSLPRAVQTAYLREIIASARGEALEARPRPDDMALGGPRSGTRDYEAPEGGALDWNRLADASYERVMAG